MKPLRPNSKIAAIWSALLRRRNGLTCAEAFSIGECHLPASIAALKRAGYSITVTWHTGRTRYNNARCRYVRYRAAPLNQK